MEYTSIALDAFLFDYIILINVTHNLATKHSI